MPTDNQEPAADGRETETGGEQGQVQETSGQEVEAPSSQAGDTKPPRGVALEDDDELDVEIAEAAPRRRSCAGPLFVVFLVAVVVVVGLFLRDQWIKKQIEIQKQEEAYYRGIQENVSTNLTSASKLAADGKVQEAYDELTRAQGKLSEAATHANANRDTQRAEAFFRQQDELRKKIEEIDVRRAEIDEYSKQIAELEAQIKSVKAKRKALATEISESIQGVVGVAPSTDAGSATEREAAGANQAAPAANAAPAETATNAEPAANVAVPDAASKTTSAPGAGPSSALKGPVTVPSASAAPAAAGG